MNPSGAERHKPVRKQRSLGNFFSSAYLSDLASQYCPIVSIQNEKSDNDEFETLENQVAGHQFVEGESTIETNIVSLSHKWIKEMYPGFRTLRNERVAEHIYDRPGNIWPSGDQHCDDLTCHEGKYFRLLKCKNGTVLKPITKINVGLREVGFFRKIQNTSDAFLIEMRDYVPKFYGTRIIDINGQKTEFLILENLLSKFLEPCVMDVKIGRRTWDPSASEMKIAKEKEKYRACKESVGFCIPGFQVYKHSTGRVQKYNKDYGKKLNESTISDVCEISHLKEYEESRACMRNRMTVEKERPYEGLFDSLSFLPTLVWTQCGALKIFLNADENGYVNRSLLMQLLTNLWRIQKWARIQTSLRLYSASLLIVYDDHVLRNIKGAETSIISTTPTSSNIATTPNIAQRKISFTTPSYSGDYPDRFSGEISPAGPVYRKSTCVRVASVESPTYDRTAPLDTETSWHKDFHKMRKSNSFQMNYNDYLSKIKLDYTATLEELKGTKHDTENWCSVNIIDFAHAYFPEDKTVDTNFSEGVDNLVNILEQFLNS